MTDSYGFLAQGYDALTVDVDYAVWADYIEWHFNRLKIPVHEVVELACGTGSLAQLLARRGYAITAVDLSEDMLCLAQQKCGGLPVQFIHQDMSRLSLPMPADAVLCCLDSVNYVTRPLALQKTFSRVFRYLKPGGLFLFDAKTPLALEEADGQVYLDETEELYCVWRGAYDPRRRLCGYGIDLFRLLPDGSWERGGEYHEEYAYTPEELTDFLCQAGFRDIRLFGDRKKRAPGADARRIFFAARKDA